MDVIWEIHGNLDTDVEFEESEAAASDKVEQTGSLAGEGTAAILIAHELRDEEVNGTADIEPGIEDVEFFTKVASIGEVWTLERDGKDEDGRVINIEVADKIDRIRVSLWDEMTAGAKENLKVGTVPRIGGRPRDGYNDVEINASKVEEDLDVEVDVQMLDSYRTEDLALGLSNVGLEGKILDAGTARTFDRDGGTEGHIPNLSVGDPTGRIRVTFWDERADLAEELKPGQSVEVIDDYACKRDGSLELHVSSRGAVEPIDEDIEYVPETTSIGSFELGQTVDIAGGVIETDGKRTSDRGDDSERQVWNIRAKDGIGGIRVALRGEKADADVDLVDYVVITSAEVREGWQEDLEVFTDWRSSVTVTGEAPESAAGTNAGGSAPTSSSDKSLGAFSGDGSPDDTSAVNGGSLPGAPMVEPTGETVEFTGTVVQAGTPIILDDGTQTKIADTDADLDLGDEVTVSGTETDGRASAESVEAHAGAQQ